MIKIKSVKITIDDQNYLLTDHEVRHFVNDFDDFYAFKFNLQHDVIPVHFFQNIHNNVILLVTFVDVDNIEYTNNVEINSNDFILETIKNKTWVKFVKNDLLATNKNTYKIIFSLKGTITDIFLENGIFITKCFLKSSVV